ncbi:NAD(P)H-dependent oxidoreductase [Hahella sp. CR1]|uniref:NAD(P)H-dependent oxidoreductase n=1 Tax=Hahella sp. CR1 TaxID=2992807 RepID=UPI002442346A|nr:NAD(P)H-dependent oxidoreductase [Hahella sp. CR1]MDG9669421.1 NAD(P)H-dependent oxidoreductase [Hahella sp. CR1]
MKTTLLMFHSRYRPSRINAALMAVAQTLDNLDVVDMNRLYPDERIDVATEIDRLLQSERLILQFPIQWYSTPPLLQRWQDLVLTHMYYLDYENTGRRFEGAPVMIATTAGNTEAAYQPRGQNRFTMETLLTPLQATANRCRLPWGDPFVVYQADYLTDAELDVACQRYLTHIQNWRTEFVRGQ